MARFLVISSFNNRLAESCKLVEQCIFRWSSWKVTEFIAKCRWNKKKLPFLHNKKLRIYIIIELIRIVMYKNNIALMMQDSYYEFSLNQQLKIFLIVCWNKNRGLLVPWILLLLLGDTEFFNLTRSVWNFITCVLNFT